MESARIALAILGLAFAVAGIAVSWTIDRLVGIVILLVGAFLLIIPLTNYRADD